MAEPKLADFEWADPPRSTGKRGPTSQVWVGRLAPLKERPGVWARVHIGRTAWVQFKRSAPYIDWTLYETTMRVVDGQRELYARYIGNGS